MIIEKYFSYITEHLNEMMENEKGNIEAASWLIVDSIVNGGRMYIFGSGHSHMIAEEVYIRAGGLALVRPILPPELMLHEMPNKSTYLERLDGYASAMLELHKVEAGDTIVIISNSGRNKVPVEMAMKAKEIGCKVIVMTSLEHSNAGTSRHSSGKRMYEFADVTLDTHMPKGDAAFYVDGLETPTGPISDFIGIAMINALMVSVIDGLVKEGVEVPVFKSSNLDGADDYNNELFDRYYGYNK